MGEFISWQRNAGLWQARRRSWHGNNATLCCNARAGERCLINRTTGHLREYKRATGRDSCVTAAADSIYAALLCSLSLSRATVNLTSSTKRAPGVLIGRRRSPLPCRVSHRALFHKRNVWSGWGWKTIFWSCLNYLRHDTNCLLNCVIWGLDMNRVELYFPTNYWLHTFTKLRSNSDVLIEGLLRPDSLH